MPSHATGTRDDLLAACDRLREREEELGRLKQELAAERRKLPWVKVDKEYTLDTDQGLRPLRDCFDGRSQLLVYHLMFGPDWTAPCPACSSLVDNFDAMLPHLNARDVTLMCVSQAPLPKLQAIKRRMGWRFPYASSFQRDFKADFGASFTGARQREVAEQVLPQFEGDAGLASMAASCGTDLAGYVTTEAPGLDAFALEPDGSVYHTFTSVPFGGLDLGFEMLLDRTPRGGKKGVVLRRHDEYELT